MLRSGGRRDSWKARASTSSPAVPVALSMAPLKMLSPVRAKVLPRWSQCAM